MKYVLAIDQSTSASKAVIFDRAGAIAAKESIAHAQLHPRPGWMEHDPEEIYRNVIEAARRAMRASGIDRRDVACISVTNQRETVMLWDAATGKPLYPAIVWQCNRAASFVRKPHIACRADDIYKKTGLTLSPYFSAAKAGWIMRYTDTAGKEICFGTMDSWLLWKLTGEHVTDYSNASRTQLFNIHKLCWDRELIELFGLGMVRFPKVLFSDTVAGVTTMEGIFDAPVPVAGIMGDSHSALFGQCCFAPGMGKATFGTGTSVMINVGDKPMTSMNGLTTSVGWGIGNRIQYVLEGNVNASGDTLKWLVDSLGILETVEQAEQYARQIPDNQGVYLVPAFTGMGAPYWDDDARACICGLFRNAGKYHVTRAGIEAIAYQIADIMEAVRADFGSPILQLSVDGGATQNELLMQFTADIVRVTVEKKNIEELSAFGSAFAAGLAVRLWEKPRDIEKLLHRERLYQPEMPQDTAQRYYDGWKTAVKKARLRT